MSNHVLNRQTFTISRMMEFFTTKELQMQIGHPIGWWPAALLKELVDNALDACEGAGVQPSISVVVGEDFLIVEDNGPGLPRATLERSLDYAIRVSDKSNYVSPSRGQLGNALKCVWAAPFVATGGDFGCVEIVTGGYAHRIEVSLDRIAQKPVLKHTIQDAIVKNGTSITMHWPEIASSLSSRRGGVFYNASWLVQQYAAFNPHARFSIQMLDNTSELLATSDAWIKWSPADPTSPHWYSEERLRTLIGACIASEREGAHPRTVREFISEFRGLRATGKQKEVAANAGLSGALLHDLVRDGNIDQTVVRGLLVSLKQACKPVQPQSMGIIGQEHLTSWMVQDLAVASTSVRYKAVNGFTASGLPFVLEVAFGVGGEMDDLSMVAGVNWTPMLSIPFSELSSLLGECRVDWWDPVVVIVHLACPQVEFTDRGKSHATLPEEISQAMATAIKYVTKVWKDAKRKADRDDRLSQRQLEQLQKEDNRPPLTVKEAAYQVMEKAYMKASSGNTLPANARQIMYAARPMVIELTGKAKPWSKSAYFTQTLLPGFVDDHPHLTEKWDIVYDARGRLMEPHTDFRVDLGTISVRDYIGGWSGHVNDGVKYLPISAETKTFGPENRYQFVLFVEKEGFNELLRFARFAERYDLAIMSTKGMSVTASRKLVESLSEKSVTVLVLHDFDKSGFSIVQTLRTDTRRYQYTIAPKVIDLGLRLADVQDMNLEKEDVTYDSGVDPKENLRDGGASEEECSFLVGGGRPKAWYGHRVELNAMSSDQLVTWLDGKLEKAGVCKIVPDEDVLGRAYRRAVCVSRIQKEVDMVVAKYDGSSVEIPVDLSQRIGKMIHGTTMSWDFAVSKLARAG